MIRMEDLSADRKTALKQTVSAIGRDINWGIIALNCYNNLDDWENMGFGLFRLPWFPAMVDECIRDKTIGSRVNPSKRVGKNGSDYYKAIGDITEPQDQEPANPQTQKPTIDDELLTLLAENKQISNDIKKEHIIMVDEMKKFREENEKLVASLNLEISKLKAELCSMKIMIEHPIEENGNE